MASTFDWPKGIVQRALREGVSARESLRIFRGLGGRIRTQTWERLYSQAQIEGVTASREFASPLRRIPTSTEIQTATSRRATGYMQRVTVLGRDAAGLVIAKDVSIRPGQLVSRQAAIDKALALVQAGMVDPETRDRYPLRALIGGFYQGTYVFEPEEA